jgi:hypothetical protein
MDNALYYTFSTIAQALAAAMALLAAFAMFRLKAIDDECLGAAKTIDSMTGGGMELRQHYSVSDWTKFVEEVDRRVTDAGRNVPTVTAALERIDRLMQAEKAIRSELWLSLILTAIVMGSSVAALALVPLIVNVGVAPLILGLGVVAFGVCLWAYVRLVRESLPPG